MSDLNACAAHEAVTEARLRRIINERFGSDVPMGIDHLSMMDDLDVRIQQMQRHINDLKRERDGLHNSLRAASAQITELSDLLSEA